MPTFVPSAAEVEPPFYQHVVVGCGGIGSATLNHLTKLINNGFTPTDKSHLPQRILGVEQFALGHANGSSHDRSRAIRYFYHNIAYMHMVRYAFNLWRELEAETGLRIVHQCGTVWLASTADAASTALIDTCHKIMLQFSHKEHVQQFQLVDEVWLAKNYPYLQFPTGTKLRGVYDPLAGFVDPVTAVDAFQQGALRGGAEIWEHSSVVDIKVQHHDGGNKLYTITVKRVDDDSEKLVQISTQNLYLCTGAWTNQLLRHLDFQLPLAVSQEQLMYCDIAQDELPEILKESSPLWPGTFFYECGDADMRIFYFFPSHSGPRGDEYVPPKIAIHAKTDIIDPQNIMGSRSFGENAELTKAIREFLDKHVPLLANVRLKVKRCLYSLTPDHDMVVDNCGLFGHPNVYVFLGAAQGFKFSSLVGRYFALSGTKTAATATVETDTDREILHLIDSTLFLKLNRPAIVDNTFKPKNCWL